MRNWLFIILTALLLLRCQSSSKKSDLARISDAERVKWLTQYRQARTLKSTNPLQSCEQFTLLAKDKNFPLATLATIHSYEVCPPQAEQKFLDLNSVEPWMRPQLVQALYTFGTTNDDKILTAQMLLEMAKASTRINEKTDFLQRARGLVPEGSSLFQDLERRLYKVAPRLQPHPKRDDYLSVALDFRRVRDFDHALEYYQKVIDDPKRGIEDKISGLKGVRSTYKIQQKKIEYITATENLHKYIFKNRKTILRSRNGAKLLMDSYLTLARTYWTYDRDADAVQVVEAGLKNLKNKTNVADLYWLMARILEERREYAEAIEWYDRTLKVAPENSNLADSSSWYKAWSLGKLKKWQEGADVLQALVNTKANVAGGDPSKYRFWLARFLLQVNQREPAEKLWREIIDTDPLNYYSFLSYRELALPFEQMLVDDPIDTSPQSEATGQNPLFTEISTFTFWLIDAEEEELARAYLDQAFRWARKKESISGDKLVAFLNLYSAAGHFGGLFLRVSELGPEQRRDFIRRFPHFFYPRPFQTVVNDAANRSGVRPELIYGIMRQESAFNRFSRSQMDAFGLMQLLPEVAGRTAKKNFLTYSRDEELYDPQTNINLGAHYLKELWDKYNGSFILAVASYNASEEAIKSWLKTRFTGDPIEFIEDIPYEETRGYVKLVMRNYLSYMVLNSSPKEAQVFPTKILLVEANKSADTNKNNDTP